MYISLQSEPWKDPLHESPLVDNVLGVTESLLGVSIENNSYVFVSHHLKLLPVFFLSIPATRVLSSLGTLLGFLGYFLCWSF